MNLSWSIAAIYLFGFGLEIWGILKMANGLMSLTRTRHVVPVLWSALWKGSKAEGLVRAVRLGTENRHQSLQGLALVALGFLIQAVATVVEAAVS